VRNLKYITIFFRHYKNFLTFEKEILFPLGLLALCAARAIANVSKNTNGTACWPMTQTTIAMEFSWIGFFSPLAAPADASKILCSVKKESEKKITAVSFLCVSLNRFYGEEKNMLLNEKEENLRAFFLCLKKYFFCGGKENSAQFHF